MFILVLPDGETYAQLDGCVIAAVPDGSEPEQIEALLRGEEEEELAALRSYERGSDPAERLVFLDDGGRGSRWRVASEPIVAGALAPERSVAEAAPLPVRDGALPARARDACAALRQAEAHALRAAELIEERCGEGAEPMSAGEGHALSGSLRALARAERTAAAAYEAAYGRFLACASRRDGAGPPTGGTGAGLGERHP